MKATAPDGTIWFVQRRLAAYPPVGGAFLTERPPDVGEDEWVIGDVQFVLRLPYLVVYPFQRFGLAARARYRRAPYVVEAWTDEGKRRLRWEVRSWSAGRRACAEVAAAIASGDEPKVGGAAGEAAPPIFS